MFDIGFWEMAFIGVIALVIIGPERLPGVARTVGLWVGKGRRMLSDVKSDVKREMKEYDLEQVRALKEELDSTSRDIKDIASSNPDPLGMKDVSDELKEAMDSTTGIAGKHGKKTRKKASKKKKVAKGKPVAKKASRKKSAKSKPKAKTSAPVTKSRSASKAVRKKTTAKKAAVKKPPAKKSVQTGKAAKSSATKTG